MSKNTKESQFFNKSEISSDADVIFVGTFPPIECGIATYMKDLIEAHDIFNEGSKSHICVVADNEDHILDYPAEVVGKIRKNIAGDYRKAAVIINENYKLLHVQHEFGIFGGSWGGKILGLTENLTIPLVVTFHTLARNPSRKACEIIQKLIAKCDRFFIMAETAIEILRESYGVSEFEKARLIPHGTPPVSKTLNIKHAKKQIGYEGKNVISTFGLISKGKGLEYMVDAMGKVVDRFPDTQYLILGKTHPKIIESEGEEYRLLLKKMIQKKGLCNNVRFINKYFKIEELLLYLNATDIYITPYLEYNQMVSGTLAYALSLGKVIVSTPYIYAKELLADGRGFFSGFRDSRSLADRIIRILGSPSLMKNTEKKALAYTEKFAWNFVGEQVAIFHKELINGAEEAVQKRQVQNTRKIVNWMKNGLFPVDICKGLSETEN
ncbi:MAG: glycosyltransferase family 4 protein [Candidatus Theseobacter exili]|nr:glycosyltransferase family 4 protein [Candidatus Theseobacter exili]